MRNWRVWVRNAAIVTAIAAGLNGCVVVPARGYGYYYVTPAVAVEPPPPVVETYGVAPGPGFVWIGGYWNWVGGRHVWVGGHWDRGRPGYAWEPHHWVHEGGGWRLAQGRWVRH